jgi:ribonuclease P protein component
MWITRNRHPWTTSVENRAREVRRLTPGLPRAFADGSTGGGARKGRIPRRRRGWEAPRWREVAIGSTLVSPVRRRSSTRVITGNEAVFGNTEFRKSRVAGRAQLPGRPQGEANIPTQRPQAGEEARLPSPDVDQGRSGHPVVPPAQGPSQPDGLIWAVRDRATFEALRKAGRRVRRGPITVTWLAGDPAEPPRVAYAIGRRTGGAVVRNRIRRRLRAITREVRAQLRPGAYLFGATAAATSLSYDDLRATVCQALGALHRP